MNHIEGKTRRAFLQESGFWLGSALVVSYGGQLIEKAALAADAATFAPSLFIAIAPDGKVTLVCHRSEMGQGIRTSMAMLLADELEVDLRSITLVQADGDERYGDQNTDGSHSVSMNWTRLREAGAAAREMLVAAAAKKWAVAPESCHAQAGHVYRNASKKSLTYGELVAAAAELKVPAHPKIKADAQLRLIGTGQPSVDLEPMLAGKSVFGIDVVVDEMVYASLERAPTVGGKIKSLDSAAALASPGVLKVVRLKGIRKYTNNAVAVVAGNTWSALQGRRALKVEWENEAVSGSTELRAALEKSLESPGKNFRKDGDFEAQLQGAARVVEARYHAPFLVHATMEPLACVARVLGDDCEIWAPTQDPQGTLKDVAKLLGFKENKIKLHVTMLGGGFGRKSQPDFVLEAVALAKELGRAVKITWTREDEIRHGFYHPESTQRMTATLDKQGKVTGWRHRSAFTTIARLFDAGATEPAGFEMGMGCTNFPYHVPHVLCEGSSAPTDVRVAWLRSVCNIFHAFSVNSFLDELAHETGRDAVQLRLDMLEPYGIPEWDKKSTPPLDTGRLANVLKLAASQSGWGRKLASGTGLGIACHYSFKSYVAVALEVKMKGSKLQVTRADCVIDSGRIVNADSVKAQMEGSMIFGLSAALYGEITLKGGMVEQSNFHDYSLMRMPEAPKIRVQLVKSDAPPTGVGEPGVPSVAPALCAAIFQATGKRIRDLPVARHLS
ncbi:MAG: xanthine dehydrogenase family protein molybdopterin-binding subunit [Deltaproteobacteria bacterium]|nr:xanthine dehydrogenase family protein molybdopterin-binding subunit [Deltaproteobacteria bacterium]